MDQNRKIFSILNVIDYAVILVLGGGGGCKMYYL